MVRVLICLFCLAVALGITSNRRRAERDAARALATLEMAYDLPRLGEVREQVLDRLRITKEWTTGGTQLGLVLTAIVVWFLPERAGVDPFVLAGLVWWGGQAGRAFGSVRRAKPGDARSWREVVPMWLAATWGLGGLLLLAFLAWCMAREGAFTAGMATVAATGALVLLAAWLVRTALGAQQFLPAALPTRWHEALRGDAVRAAFVLVPGAIGIALPSLVSLASLGVVQRSQGDPAILIGLAIAGLLSFALTMLLGWLAVRWHAARLREAETS